MGILKVLLNANNATGIREAMRIAYKKASKHNFLFDVSDEMHRNGLFAALATRYLTYGVNINEIAITIELAPFYAMDSQEMAIDALSEYIVYKEKPIEARIDGLKVALKGAIDGCSDSSIKMLIDMGIKANCPWIKIIDVTSSNNIMEDDNTKNISVPTWLRGGWVNENYLINAEAKRIEIKENDTYISYPNNSKSEEYKNKYRIMYLEEYTNTHVVMEFMIIDNNLLFTLIRDGYSVEIRETLNKIE